ncbi:MAG: hypothetical protein E7642_01895 [Ruminococcaceae bacterium]|nr:hypothetical protein [Oscillospiraceae bacterium]
MRKKMILITIYSFILLGLTVSFAWILDFDVPSVPYLQLGYGKEFGNNKLVVSPQEVEMTLYVQKDGVWRYVGSNTDKNSGKLFAVDPQDVIPNSSIPFRIRLKNLSDETISINVNMTGVVCDKVFVEKDEDGKEKEVIFVSAIGSTEYIKYPEVTQPIAVYYSVNDGKFVEANDENNTVMYNIELYDKIEVPVTADGEYVELDCYFYFDKDAMTNSCQNKTFYVSSFRAEQQ